MSSSLKNDENLQKEANDFLSDVLKYLHSFPTNLLQDWSIDLGSVCAREAREQYKIELKKGIDGMEKAINNRFMRLVYSENILNLALEFAHKEFLKKNNRSVILDFPSKPKNDDKKLAIVYLDRRDPS